MRSESVSAAATIKAVSTYLCAIYNNPFAVESPVIVTVNIFLDRDLRSCTVGSICSVSSICSVLAFSNYASRNPCNTAVSRYFPFFSIFIDTYLRRDSVCAINTVNAVNTVSSVNTILTGSAYLVAVNDKPFAIESPIIITVNILSYRDNWSVNAVMTIRNNSTCSKGRSSDLSHLSRLPDTLSVAKSATNELV